MNHDGERSLLTERAKGVGRILILSNDASRSAATSIAVAGWFGNLDTHVLLSSQRRKEDGGEGVHCVSKDGEH